MKIIQELETSARRVVPLLVLVAACTHAVDPIDPDRSIRWTPDPQGVEGTGSITVIASRIGDPSGPISATYATADATATVGADYTASSGTLQWADGDTADKTISIPLLDDLTIEGDETLSIVLSDAIGAQVDAAITLVIRDDDRVGDSLALTSNDRLISFDRDSAAVLRHAALLSGLASDEHVVDIDVRPRDGKLYAVTDRARVYVIDPPSGTMTLASTLVADPGDTTEPFTGLSGAAFGIDFNPVPDRLRVVSDTGQNLRIDVDTGRTFTDGTIRGAVVGLAAAGYANNFAAACRTKLYAIDTATDRLVIQDPPNDGTTATVGAGLGVDVSAATLDLVTAQTGETTAFAVLAVGGSNALYEINLAAGSPSRLGELDLEAGETVRGLALQPRAAIGPIPQAPGELYGVTDANRLITFNRAAPAKACTSASIAGLAPQDTIVDIDVRPSTGILYALARNAGQGTLYVVDPVTGAASSPVPLTQPLVGTVFGIDFNPTGPVALRIISDAGQNLRVTDVTTGATTADSAIGGTSLGVSGAAYTNSLRGAGATTLYTIDPEADRLHIQSPPNAGTQVDVGALGLDATAIAGFEIDGRDNTAVVALDLPASIGTTLHTVDLTTGAASASLGTIAGGVRLRGLTRPTPVITVFGLLEPNLLARISITDPSTPTPVGAVTGLAPGETLLGIDVRPSTGILYGLGSLGGIYAIDPATAAGTRVSTLAADPTDTTSPYGALAGADFGLDFNPTGPVALRVISDAQQNLRIPNVLTGAAISDLSLTAPQSLAPPSATAAAYSNSFPGSTVTTLFVIDVASAQLMIQAPPNNGVLNPVGALSPVLGFGGVSAFDIAGGANGIALATLQRRGGLETFSRLYRIDLATGAATELGNGIGTGPAVRGLAIQLR